MQNGCLANLSWYFSINKIHKSVLQPIHYIMKAFCLIAAQMRNNFLLTLLLVFAVNALAAQNTKPAEKPFVFESYYKIKWGYAQEFIDLWRANYYPLQKKAMENGDIISIVAEKPRMHSGEDTRWDFKVTIVYKTGLGLGQVNTDAYKKDLYPDLVKLAKDEQYRFTLLLAHWDILTEKIELK